MASFFSSACYKISSACYKIIKYQCYKISNKKSYLASGDFCARFFLFLTPFVAFLKVRHLGYPQRNVDQNICFLFFGFAALHLLHSLLSSSSVVLTMLPLMDRKLIKKVLISNKLTLKPPSLSFHPPVRLKLSALSKSIPGCLVIRPVSLRFRHEERKSINNFVSGSNGISSLLSVSMKKSCLTEDRTGH